MKTIIIVAVVVIILVIIAVFLYMKYLTSNSPSIMDRGYDEKMQEEFGENENE